MNSQEFTVTEKPKDISLSSVIIRVAIFSHLRQCFDYLVPDTLSLECGLNGLLEYGMRVLVPFGKTTRVGVISDIVSHSEIPHDKLKTVLELIDKTSLFPNTLQHMIRFASHYYHHSLGEVFETALPKYLRKGKCLETIKSKTSPLIDLVENISNKNFTVMLNKEQAASLSKIVKAIKEQKFQPFLLEGVTGSGKTEVYLEAIAATLEKGKQALILVPEIGLTPQMLERLKKRFSIPIALIHSGLTDKQRFLAWNQARLGQAPIVLGTRSAVFTPLQNPGLFIVDEEHDPSFKQQDNFRYSGRDLLVMRGSLDHCPVVLGTATPSLETFFNVEKKQYQKLILSKRANSTMPPKINILDIRHKKLNTGLSSSLIKSIKEHLEMHGQVLLFLNRRGFAPVYMCFDCGQVAQCHHCDARLTLHYQKRHLKCHHCEFTRTLYQHCPFCKSENLNPVGVGTQRIESYLGEIFPHVPILRIDRDTTRKKGALKSLLDRIQTEKPLILLGTQMLAKGHHFPHLSLVAILDIDNALFSLDFRTMERLGQLLTQVSGRAGRADKLGEVLLQTCHPNHPLLQQLLQEGYNAFANTLLMERKISKLPPYSYAALVRAKAKKIESALLFLNHIKNALGVRQGALEIFGPVAAPMEKRNNAYHAQLLLQSPSRKILQRSLTEITDGIEKVKGFKNVRWSMDVDPIDLF